MKYRNTLNEIMNSLKKEVPIIEDGDILETFSTIYPDYSIKRKEKNVIIEGTEMTVPLAASQSAKDMMKKDGSTLLKIYKDVNRGDILKVKKIEGNKITVENSSLKEEFRKDFVIDKFDIMKKNFVVIQRRSADLTESLKNIGFAD
jgi:hypothetical protein